MLGFLLPLAGKLGISKGVLIAISVAVVAVIFGLFIWSWDARGNKITKLQAEIAVLNDTVIVERANTQIAIAGRDIAVSRLAETNQVAVGLSALSGEARNVSPSNNAPLAPVLRNVLIGLDGIASGMRNGTQAPATGVRPRTTTVPSNVPRRAPGARPQNSNPARSSYFPTGAILGLGELFGKPSLSQNVPTASQNYRG
jgi:hypothetical protein